MGLPTKHHTTDTAGTDVGVKVGQIWFDKDDIHHLIQVSNANDEFIHYFWLEDEYKMYDSAPLTRWHSLFEFYADSMRYEDFKQWCETGEPPAISKMETAQTDEPTADNVNNPHHYTQGDGIECIDAIKAALTDEEFRGFCKGNVLKYTWREKHKGQDESLAKAIWYLNKLLEN